MQSKSSLDFDALAGRLDSLVPNLLQDLSVPGLAIALTSGDGPMWSKQYGLKSSKSGEHVEPGTLFESASLSKPLFGYAVLQLCDEGRLDLDTPLQSYLPQLYIPDPTFGTITARMILSHRTGLPNWRPDGEALELRRAPGLGFGYSGEGFLYLQRVVEQVTGEPLDQFIARETLAPLGMAASSYSWRDEFATAEADGHDANGEVIPQKAFREANAAYSLITSPLEYARFVSAMLAPEQGLLAAAALREMMTPQVQLNESLSWGLSWGLQQSARGTAFWHWGDNPGFKNLVLGDLTSGAAVVIMTNGENGMDVCAAVLREVFSGDYPLFAMLDNFSDYRL